MEQINVFFDQLWKIGVDQSLYKHFGLFIVVLYAGGLFYLTFSKNLIIIFLTGKPKALGLPAINKTVFMAFIPKL